jgi:hypothetical protein
MRTGTQPACPVRRLLPQGRPPRYGYAKVTNRRYKCSVYDNGQCRWKRV